MNMRLKPVIVFSLLTLSMGSAIAQQAKKTTALDVSLRDELIEMGKEDQRHRGEIEQLAREMAGPNGQEALKKFDIAVHRQDEIDKRNLGRLEQIIEKHGWPGETLVGREASLAAFHILQHAELRYQIKYFPLLKAAAGKKEARLQDAAMLEDRILVRENKKQIYGTQVRMNQQTKALELEPIDDEVNVDTRRAAVGLPPMAEYVKRFGLTYTPPKKN
jgi:hypothetical protein